MHIQVSVIGALKDKPLQMIEADYCGRLHRWPLKIVELSEKKILSDLDRQQKESALIEKSCPNGGVLWLLDERGEQHTSTELARMIGAAEQNGVSSVVFAIGGADGHSPYLREKATKMLAFGRQTWPHRWARVMVIEQIYRAQQILLGHPYHRS